MLIAAATFDGGNVGGGGRNGGCNGNGKVAVLNIGSVFAL